MAMRCLVSLLWGLPLRALAQLRPRDLLTDFLTFPLQNVTAAAQANPDELFTIIFVADSESRMRGNTNDEVRSYINNLASYKTDRAEYFDAEGGARHRIDPQLVILGGDISADRQTSVVADASLWQPLWDQGVALIAGFGNHDWTGRGQYSVEGDTWNSRALEFCRDTYRNATRVAAPYFGYREFGPTDRRGPVTSVAHFRGVQIVNFNSFLYQPSYHYDFESESGQACVTDNAFAGWDGCQVFSSAEPQIQRLEAALDADAGTPTLVVQHYPMSTEADWWSDHGASGTSVAQKKWRLMNLLGRYDSSVLLSGHNHHFSTGSFYAGSGIHTEFVAPYFGGHNGADLNQGGGFLALLVSRTRGIVEVKHVQTPLYDAARTTARPYTTTTIAGSSGAGPTDLSILGTVGSSEEVQECVLANCFSEALECAGDSTCYSLLMPVVSSGSSISPSDMAQLLWAASAALSANPAALSVAMCTDSSCGSAILGSRDVEETSTTEGAARPRAGTTWNPWVADPLAGCPGLGGVSLAATAALVATGRALLPRY
mmetsp:Transcript_1680/g.5228  ORF Transcript_1680/g.5228 Transcript_1680/m.5228 type:complete len:544 (+) Transcript_1680:59-1690(+)